MMNYSVTLQGYAVLFWQTTMETSPNKKTPKQTNPREVRMGATGLSVHSS